MEYTPSTEPTPTGTPNKRPRYLRKKSTNASTRTSSPPPEYAEAVLDDGASGSSDRPPILPFRRGMDSRRESIAEDDEVSVRSREEWGVADEVRMGLE